MQRRSESFWEFLNPEFLTGVLKAGILKSYSGEIGRQFENPKIQEILNFPVLFLGATPEKTPYLYSLMADTMLSGGTHYIQGGMNLLIDKIIKIADRLGVDFLLSHALVEIKTAENKQEGPESITLKPSKDTFYSSAHNDGLTDQNSSKFTIPVKSLVLGLDYQHGEKLLPQKYRRYDLKYWKNRVMAPSCLLYYLGFDTKIDGLKHHNLFFDTDFKAHAKDIYTTPKLPKDPLFYICCPSKTDSSVAPIGSENLFALVPIATHLEVSKKDQQYYLNQIFERLQKNLNLNFELKDRLVVKHFFGPSEFVSRYNSWGGNGYGLANTLSQTAIFKPKMRSKLKKTYFAGQLTIPGPGMPPCLISGKIASEMLLEDLG
jgi:phytoene desaturase